MSAISNKFSLMMNHQKLDAIIVYMEEGLRDLKTTAFHSVLGKSFSEHVPEFAALLIKFHQSQVAAGKSIAAIYVEMNGFSINTDQWHCHVFGYEKCGNAYDLDWLCDWNSETEDEFVLKSMAEVQAAFEESCEIEGDAPLSYKICEEIAEHLVTAHFMNLVAEAHLDANQIYAGLREIRVFATAHDWDVVHVS